MPAIYLSSKYIVAASGDTTGATDLAAIQASLNASNNVMLQPGAQYYVNGPITMSSNSLLTAYGAKITLVAGVFGNIIRNKAVLPSRVLTDASVIGIPQSSTINTGLTSPTANFTSADIGSTVGMFGAGSAASASVAPAWYGTITSVINAATATVWTASTGKTIGLFGRPTTLNHCLYQATTAGTTGTTQPTWPTTIGSTVTDGTVVWTCLGDTTAAFLNQPALNTVTNGIANIYVPADRNDNITIQGGTWTITENLGGGHVTTSTFQNSFASAFRRVSNLRIKDTTWQTFGPTNQGGRFTISIADFTNVVVDGTYFISTAGDGVHLTGPGDTALVSNTRGTCGDDMVVTNLQDSNTPYIMDTEGSLANVTVRDLVAKNSGSRGFCTYDLGQGAYSGTPARWIHKNLHVERISGVTANPLVLIQSTIDGLLIRAVVGAPTGAGVPLIDFYGTTGNGFGATIEDVVWMSTLPATSGIIRLASPRGPHHIKNLRFDGNSVGTNIGILINGTVNGSGFGMPFLTLDGFYTGNVAAAVFSPSPQDATAIVFSPATSTGQTVINVRNYFSFSTTGYVVQKTGAMSTQRINITDSALGSTAGVLLPANDTITQIGLSNVRSSVPLVKTSSPVAVEMVNCDCTSATALVQFATTTAGPSSIRMANSTQTGAGTLFTRDGAQAIRVRGTDIPVDQTLLTPGDGDMIYNSNAATPNGIGMSVWNSNGAKWKNLNADTSTPPVVVSAPIITAIPMVGMPLSIIPGSFTGAVAILRSIYSGNTLVAGPAVNATYTPVSADIGNSFKVDDVGINEAGSTHDMSAISPICSAASVQQAMRTRSNDLFTGGSTGLATSYYKVEFDESFDVAQWLVQSSVSSGTPGTYKVQLAVTDTIAVDTINNAFVPMRAGVAYNDTSANGWQNATFGGATSKQIGLAPSAGNNSAISMITDALALSSVARADGKPGGILLVKVVQTDAAGAFTQDKSTNAAWDAARGSQTWFREYFATKRASVDGIASLSSLASSVSEGSTGYAIMGCPLVTTSTNTKPTDLIMFTGDSRKAAAYSTYAFNNPNRQAVMSLSTAAHPLSIVDAAGSGHSQSQYLAVAMDMLNSGIRPTVIYLAGFSQNGFVDYTTFKTANDNFMTAARAIPGLANVKFIIDTDYFVSGYAGTAKESYRQQCITYAKSLANGTTVFCFDSDPIMTDYTTPSTPVLKSALMNADGVHANQAGQDAMTNGDGTYTGLQALYKTVLGIV